MKKKLILLIFVLTNMFVSAQNAKDTSDYYIKVDNPIFIDSLQKCISFINQWNENKKIKKGIISINISTQFNKITTYTVSELTNYDMDNVEMPDYLSYMNDQLIFWYFGKTALQAKSNLHFQNYVQNTIHKYFLDPVTGRGTVNPIELALDARILVKNIAERSNTPRLIPKYGPHNPNKEIHYPPRYQIEFLFDNVRISELTQ